MSSSEAGRDPRLMRVSHADRDRVVEILREAAGEGRLEADELAQRVEAALTARTFADLEPLTADLPVGGRAAGPAAPVPGPSPARPGAPAADGAVRWEVRGLPLRREGAWAVPPVLELDVAGGSARLDYTQARLPEGGGSLIRVLVRGGSVRLTVPPGVAVDASGVEGYGGRVRDRAARRAVPGGPVTHVITLVGSLHGGSVKVVPAYANPRRLSRREERRARILDRYGYGDADGRGRLR
jgi:hypothetical protein